ncbi:ABC transporter ATP-binding protein [Catellatospora bangladeshensis]|uniref:ABC-type quaternary amine transporter n=1 Tax=Catellatospora bangladeshensis TaxID=310355 RepID=A0A8J3NKU1_9ACTN|nr:ABC transporter ATP-binding protein [Catellatospora bangladeshensis]GIF83051.1 ABC transporter [Catellatospora bangladeshensis]
MNALVVRAAHKAFGQVKALDGADLAVPGGTLTAVLGPSGCGKTTLLRCVAGFERLDAGEIALGDRPVSGPRAHVPAHRRGVAVVPQDGALFPHLDVAGNVGYGLDAAARRAGRIDEVLELVGLAGYGSRLPHQLSGGQQQRVAVARALAPRPRLVLLDEPFSALDAGLRAEVRADVRAALHADGATAVLVTHDQGEALSMADQVVVMHRGRVRQQGTPLQVYRTPADPWVAAFVGDAVLLTATADGGGARTPLGALDLHQPCTGTTTVLVRPEQIRVLPPGDAAAAVPATVRRHLFHGHDAVLDLTLDDGTPVTARLLDDPREFSPGTRVALTVSGPAHALPAGAE